MRQILPRDAHRSHLAMMAELGQTIARQVVNPQNRWLLRRRRGRGNRIACRRRDSIARLQRTQASMTSIAEGGISAGLALAETCRAGFLGSKGQRLDIRAAMRAVTEGLVGRTAAATPGVGLAGFQLDLGRSFGGDDRRACHGALSFASGFRGNSATFRQTCPSTKPIARDSTELRNPAQPAARSGPGPRHRLMPALAVSVAAIRVTAWGKAAVRVPDLATIFQ